MTNFDSAFVRVRDLIKAILASNEFVRVAKNFGFLSFIQLSNYVFPLITLPYLVKVLGAESFGLVMIAQAFTQYFIIIIDYGFNYSATREVALSKNNTNRLSETFYSIITLKTILFFISLLLLLFLLVTVEEISKHKYLYLLTFSSVLSNVLFPSWFFQGIEQMRYVTYVTVSSRVISLFLIFLFVKNESHILMVPSINSISLLIPSLFSLLYLNRIVKLTFIMPHYKKMIVRLKEGWFIFLSSISTSLYSVSNTLLLGFLFSNSFAGYYAFAEKIIRAGVSLFSVFNNALFPFMSIKMKDSKERGFAIVRLILLLIVFVGGVSSSIIYFLSDYLISIINPDFYPSVNILKILSPLLIIVGVSNLLGFQILFTNNMEKRFMIVVFLAGIINVLLCITLRNQFSINSAAISLLASELFICCSFLFYTRNIYKQIGSN